MGLLVPEDFDRRTLANDAERAVVDSFVSKLSHRWLVLPSVGIRGPHRDHELDIVLIHQDFGIVDIEVKGHRVHVSEGRWTDRRGRPLEPPPPRQALDNSHALARLIRETFPALRNLRVAWGIAFPNASGFQGPLPPEVKRDQVLGRDEVDDPVDPIEVLACTVPQSGGLTQQDVVEIVGLLRPDVDFEWDAAADLDRARRRLDERCDSQVHVLQELDVNRRVVTLGAAGTGKTRLAMAWARRAYADDRKVLLTCYNEPLADHLADALPDDPDVRIGPFLRLALSLDGMPGLAPPAPDAEPSAVFDWWTDDVPLHLHSNWGAVTERFDTVIVDEAQDLDPSWIALLERLLTEDGRLLMVADPAQELYPRGFEVPTDADGWTVSRLVTNCRNAVEIGQLLRRKLDGAPSPGDGPPAAGLRFIPVTSADDATATVEAVLADLRTQERDPARVLVLTFASDLRDRLRKDLGLEAWEHDRGGVRCENVHRAKGLESDTIVLVADRAEDATDALLYVGVSRAVSELVLIAPPAVGARLGLGAGGRRSPDGRPGGTP